MSSKAKGKSSKGSDTPSRDYPSAWSQWQWNAEHNCNVRYRLRSPGNYEYQYGPVQALDIPRRINSDQDPTPSYSSPVNYTGPSNDTTAEDFRQDSLNPVAIEQTAAPETRFTLPNNFRGFTTTRNRTTEETFDPNYRVHATREFRWGRIFKALWAEPGGGSTNTSTKSLDSVRTGKFGEVIYEKVRRFVIIDMREGHCICLPIMTYAGKGTNKRGIRAGDHAIIYTEKPVWFRGEIENGLTKEPIRVQPTHSRHNLDEASRLNYAKIYTIECNIKVWFIGKIHPDSESQLANDYNTAHPLIAPPKALTNEVYNSISERREEITSRESSISGYLTYSATDPTTYPKNYPIYSNYPATGSSYQQTARATSNSTDNFPLKATGNFDVLSSYPTTAEEFGDNVDGWFYPTKRDDQEPTSYDLGTHYDDPVLTGKRSTSPSLDRIDAESDLTSVFSADALSVVSDSSLGSVKHIPVLNSAIAHLSRLFANDEELVTLYRDAHMKFDRDRLFRNHNRLLKIYFADLKSSARSNIQNRVISILQSSKQRAKLTEAVISLSNPTAVETTKRFKSLPGEEPDKLLSVICYLENESLENQGERTENLIPVTNEDSGSESSGDNLADAENENEAEAVTSGQLELVVDFFTNGPAFRTFKASFRHFVTPPTALQQVLDGGSVRSIHRFLEKKFDHVATAEYGWLRELRETGYSLGEISEVLWEKANDSPWIFGQEAPISIPSEILPGHHRPACAHRGSLESTRLLGKDSRHKEIMPTQLSDPVDLQEIKQKVHHLCGLAGVSPVSRDRRKWNGSILFSDDNTAASVTYDLTGFRQPSTRVRLIDRIRQALIGFCAAAAMVQNAGLCCDSFTILQMADNGPGQSVVEMQRFYLTSAADLLQEFQELKEPIVMWKALKCGTLAQEILGGFCDNVFIFTGEMTASLEQTLDESLHFCALAVQVLCLGFVSYVQAHVGSIRPFFLDTPQSKLVLCGSQELSGNSKSPISAVAKLVELSCIGEMVRDSVLVFSRHKSVEVGPQKNAKHDLLASAEDLMDTWGPGQFLLDPSKESHANLYALSIGGGILQAISGQEHVFHWSDTDKLLGTNGTFSAHAKILIGASVTENEGCIPDEQKRWIESECFLVPLGTTRPVWEPRERQLGLQGGQYCNVQATMTWAKLPGLTLKDALLAYPEPQFLPYLQSPWGLQVSFCTGVARRVLLRELLADLLPTFVEGWPSMHTHWETLTLKHDLLETFRDKAKDIPSWMDTLSYELRECVFKMVHTLVSAMKDTGIDRKEEFFKVAWLQPSKPLQCFQIPCKKETYWARMVADSDTCATFAYITSKCLESDLLKCRGPTASWCQKTAQLETAVYRYCPESGVQQLWVLKHAELYTIGKSDSLLVKVYRPNNNDKPRLHVSWSLIPVDLRFRLENRKPKGLQKLREKQREESCAEIVLVLAGTPSR